MADAPEAVPVQIEALKAFSKDLELSVRTEAKGWGTKPVEAAELRAWVEKALASNTDEAVRPPEGLADEPHLGPSMRREVFGLLLKNVKARIAALEAGKAEPKESTKDWLLAQLGLAAAGKLTVPATKSGPTHKASLEEISQWLQIEVPEGAVAAPTKKKLKD